ncbi:hypothetical protein CDL15_Pgr011587 [Punica granatum]|uniref:Uncharacterized protein n=1 Tax=Punica granatum TaxID=22663 RepID=A0A218Y0H9_PUNGR|nr:hypothetical protein CDL15_Pgr011587 [Punica granatum]
MARERERVDLGPLTLTDLSDDGARCLLEGLSLEFEIAILSYEADMSPSGGDAPSEYAPWGSTRICTADAVPKAVSNCLDSMLGLPTVLEEESTLDD